MKVSGWEYGLVFAVSLSLTLVFTPVALWVARRVGVLDHPGELKAQESPVPYLGGAAIVTAFALVVLVAALVRPPTSGLDDLKLIIGAAVVLSIMGLLDDLRGLSALLRLGIEIAAGWALWTTGNGADLFGPESTDAIVTVLWVVGVTNAFNLLDNMDGLSAGVAAIAGFSFFVIAASNGQFLVATLAIALAGCAAGFLRHNFYPARIYMGDAGSLFLGFLLAVLGLKLRFDGPNDVTFFVPILLLGVALFDTTLVTVMRVANGRSPLSGGRDHTSHRLVYVGIPVRAAVSLIYAGAMSLGWLGLIMSRVDRATGWLLMAFVVGVALFLGVLLALVPVYEGSTRRRLMLLEVKAHETEPPAAPGQHPTEGVGA